MSTSTFKAMTISPAGHVEFIDIPQNDALTGLQNAVGGYIERIMTREPVAYNAFCNEEGAIEQLPVNPAGTHLVDQTAGIMPQTLRRGTIVFIGLEDVTTTGETVYEDVPEHLVELASTLAQGTETASTSS